VPVTSPDRWLELDGEGGATLLGGWSPSSGRAHFPPGHVCPYTGADDVEVIRLPRTGTLWAWTAVTAAPPGYEGPVPYGFGIVELDALRLRVVGRLTVADVDALHEGQTMVVVADDVPGGPTVWAFAPGEPGQPDGRGEA
jgi:uncharacterized OB-fold protein